MLIYTFDKIDVWQTLHYYKEAIKQKSGKELHEFDISPSEELYPNRCGIYFLINRLGQVVYVGQSFCIKKRIRAHCNSLKKREGRHRFCKVIWFVEERTDARLNLETEFIEEFKPIDNKKDNPLRYMSDDQKLEYFDTSRLKMMHRGEYLLNVLISAGLSRFYPHLAKYFFDTTDVSRWGRFIRYDFRLVKKGGTEDEMKEKVLDWIKEIGAEMLSEYIREQSSEENVIVSVNTFS